MWHRELILKYERLRSSVAALLILVGLCFSASTLAGETSNAVQSYAISTPCEHVSSTSINGDGDQEDSSGAVKDSVEFSTCISKWKENSKIIPHVVEFCRSQYKPPFMEKEQRPPQFKFV